MKPSFMFQAIIACFLWSTAFVGIKIGIPYTTPLNFAGVRFVLAGVITLLFVGNLTSSFRLLQKNPLSIIKIALLQTTLLYTLFYLGLHSVTGAMGAIITGASPLWGVVLAHFFMENDRITWQKGFAFIIGFSGIVFVAFGRNTTMGGASLWGFLAMLGASLTSGVAALLVAKDKKDMPALPLNGLQLLVGGVVLVLLSFIFEKPPFPTDIRYYLSLGYLAFLSAVAFSLWFSLIKKGVPLSSLNLWKFIIPVSGAALSWIILPDEHPTLFALGGVVLVAIAIVLYYVPLSTQKENTTHKTTNN